VQAAHSLIARLHASFDLDGSGNVDTRELAAGLSILCGGRSDDRLREAFQAFDVDSSGTLSFAEAAVYLWTTIRIFFALAPKCKEHFNSIGQSSRDLAKLAVRTMFDSADSNLDKQITMVEFLNWIKPTFWWCLNDIYMPPKNKLKGVVSEMSVHSTNLHVSAIAMSDATDVAAMGEHARSIIQKGMQRLRDL
jgi:Ca2+-binding EF-hand superfamily protein